MFESLLFRPVRETDLDQVYELAMTAQSGLSSLPKDKALIENKIHRSLSSFSKQIIEVKDELYFFVLEDTSCSKIVGTAAIIASVGIRAPFYSFRLVEKKTKARILPHITVTHELQFERQRSGPSEVGTLYLHPDYRKKGVGRYLSIARFMFIALHRHRFKDSVIAELRGVSNEHGHSPFWDEVMRHFFSLDFDEADLLSQKDKSFIEECMPKHPLVVETLSQSVQSVIGATHENTRAAKAILESEGFVETKHVDIFDAGPKLIVDRDSIAAVKRVKACSSVSFNEDGESDDLFLFSNGVLDNFSVYCHHAAVSNDDKLSISSELSDRLSDYDSLYYMKLYANKSSHTAADRQGYLSTFKQWYGSFIDSTRSTRRNQHE